MILRDGFGWVSRFESYLSAADISYYLAQHGIYKTALLLAGNNFSDLDRFVDDCMLRGLWAID